MKFDIDKFMALTALLAGAGLSGSACQTTAVRGGGDAGESGSGAGGEGGRAGQGEGSGEAGAPGTAGDGDGDGDGGNAGGAGGSAGAGGEATQGGEGGLAAGGRGAGGLAGSEGLGGSGGMEACLGDEASGGSGADSCAESLIDAIDCDGASEELNPAIDTCFVVEPVLRAGILAELISCLEAISDPCAATAGDAVDACVTASTSRACAREASVTACETIIGRAGCDTIDLDACSAAVDPLSEAILLQASECMDPSGEFFDPFFEGSCEDRLNSCLP